MAKKNETKKVEKVVLTKKQFDEALNRFLLLDERWKKEKDEADKLKALLESQYKEDAHVKEIVSGFTTQMVKIPVAPKGSKEIKHDLQILTPFLNAAGIYNEVVKMNPVLDEEKLKAVVEEGKLPQAVVETAQIKPKLGNWTFRSTFKRIETAINDIVDTITSKIS